MSPSPPVRQTFAYASRVDGVEPLWADVAYLANGHRKPLLVVMHGYGGGRDAVARDLDELASRGVVALAPDCRGRGESAGSWDSGGLDVHDILDAVGAALARYPAEIDADNLNLVGYSGGGGHAIACAVRFPEVFRTLVSFFGIADYGAWHRSGGRPDCNEWMEFALGGPPDRLPDVYESRNAIPAAANARCSRLHFFWDEEETMCPPALVEAWIEEYHRAGLGPAAVHVSRCGDVRRWIHNYRTGNPDLSAADDLFLPDVLATPTRVAALPEQGRLVVPGFVVTRTFSVWIGDGQRGRVTVEYDRRGAMPGVRVVANPRGYAVRVGPGVDLAAR